MYCRNCGNLMNDEAVVCVQCGVPAGKGNNHCPTCGEPCHPEAVICVKCGVPFKAPQPVEEKSDKSKIAAGLLGLFLGVYGVHNFYLGFTKKAVLQLILGIVTCGATSLWGLIEGILILCGYMDKDANGKKLV